MSNKGWECPKCNKVYAPWKAECDHCNADHDKPEVAPYRPITIPTDPLKPPYKLTDWPPLYKTTCGSGTTSTRDDNTYEVYS